MALLEKNITGIIEIHVCTKLKWLVHTVSMIRAEVSLGFIWKLPWSGVMEPLAIEGLRIPVIQYTATVPRDPLRTTVSATLLLSAVIKKKQKNYSMKWRTSIIYHHQQLQSMSLYQIQSEHYPQL